MQKERMNRPVKCFDVIPTPEKYHFSGQGRINADRICINMKRGDILASALRLFGECSPYELSEISSANLVITDQTETFLTREEENVFADALGKEQGYVLKKDRDEPIVIAARSELGAAYGLMTLCQLLDKEAAEFSVCDKPDIRFRGNKWLIWNETEVWSYDFGDGIDAFRERVVRKLDLCLRFKINAVFFDGWGADTERTPHYKGLMRELCKEARKRGIHLIFGAYTMGYGLSAHAFGKHFGKVYKNTKGVLEQEEYECLGTYKKDPYDQSMEPFITGRTYGTCLSNKALMKEKLEELKCFIREVQPGALYLHNMDSHVIEPMFWKARCEDCRRRWPSDDLFAKDGMAGAFAEFFDELNAGLKSVRCEDYDSAEDLLIFNVSPGYMWYVCEDEEIENATKFWCAVREYSKVKKNVFPLFRELFFNKKDSKMRFPDVVSKAWAPEFGYGIINFSGGGGFYTDKLFFASSVFNYMFKGTEALITCSGNAFQEPLQVFNAEYMWNTENSAFYNLPNRPRNDGGFMKLYVDSRNARFRPEEIFGEGGMLEIICKKLYGDHGELMSRVFHLCGKNFECVVPYPCSKETKTAGNDVLIHFRWDNELPESEIRELIDRFSEIERINNTARQMMEQAESLPRDLQSFLTLLSLNNRLVSFWHRYLELYAFADGLFKGKGGDKQEILNEIQKLVKEVRCELKCHRSESFAYADAMLGALARREEMLEVQEYNLMLMSKSIKTNQRIPDDRIILKKEIWW